MTINFDIDMDDMMSFQRHYVNTNPAMVKAKRMITYLFPLFILVFGFVGFYDRYNRLDIAFIIFLIVISVLWVVFMPKLFIRLTLNRTKKILSKPGNEIMFGTFEMRFTNTGFDVKTAAANSSILWSTIPKADETRDYFYLYLSQASAYIIPKRKISNADVESLHALFTTYLL
ncbi:MAG: YcxB family protein [Prevotellaceae bacterium]|jgi:hypothetical protein|nr:YcxB family protein [Prevotellaceae bacterium]